MQSVTLLNAPAARSQLAICVLLTVHAQEPAERPCDQIHDEDHRCMLDDAQVRLGAR